MAAHATKIRRRHNGCDLWGAGIVIRRFLLDRIFDSNHPLLLVGRTGNVLTSGDDVEMCKRILLLGYTLEYDRSLLLYHFINQNRLTWAYKKKLFAGFDLTEEVFRKYDIVYNEVNKSMMRKMKSILYFVLKIILRPGNSKKHLTSELSVRLGLLFKSAKFPNDLEYKSMLKFLFDDKT